MAEEGRCFTFMMAHVLPDDLVVVMLITFLLCVSLQSKMMEKSGPLTRNPKKTHLVKTMRTGWCTGPS